MAGSKRTGTPPKEWAKHLRPFGKKEFWSSVRNIFRSEEKEEIFRKEVIHEERLKMNKQIDVEELIQEAVPEGLINGHDELREYVDKAVINANSILDKMDEENKVTYTPRPLPIALTQPTKSSILERINSNARTAKIFFPEENKLTVNTREHIPQVLSDQCSGIEPFRRIRESMGEPGPQSTDDLLPKVTNIPPMPSVKQPLEKPLPKVITIEVSGEVGVGKYYLLHYIDKVIYERLGVSPICPELEVERNGNNVDDIPVDMLDDFESGRIIIQMKVKDTKPISFSHQCPCCD